MKSSTPEVSMTDDFTTDRKRGRVVGSQSGNGARRQGVDVEKLLSIDNGALRIQPPITPGWGRAGIAYGPYKRQAGLGLAIFMLNGHNTSEGNTIEETLKGRLFRWVRGSEANSIGNRLWRWSISPQHRGNARQFYRWVRNHRRRFEKDAHIKENLALGWFNEPVPSDPTATGHALVVRAGGPENGELCTRCCDRLAPAFKELQNLQTYYLVLLRERGAAYYAASVPNARGLIAFPQMRLVGIDSSNGPQPDSIYAGLYQSSLGQVGFRVDTRVYGIRTEVLPALANWYGTAQTADSLIGTAALTAAPAEIGGQWHSIQGNLAKTDRGLIAQTQSGTAQLKMPAAAGAVHAMIATTQRPPTCALLWRTQDEANTWGLFFENGQCQLKIQTNGQWSQIASEKRYGLQPSAGEASSTKQRAAVQVLDDGQSFSLYLNGQMLFDRWFFDSRLQTATNIGLQLSNACDTAFSQIEAHPREIPVPPELNLGQPWQTEGTRALISDSFTGAAGDLAGQLTEVGKHPWEKIIGRGRMTLTGQGSVKVEATAQRPNPGRLAYTVNWSNSTLADVSVNICPPGSDRNQGEKGRGGIIFWQDPDHYITISQWLDDTYGGASISAFFHLDGFEEIYDAVWTNVGTRILWGKQNRLRVTFDGLRFITYAGKEPVLYRSLTDVYPAASRLSIRKVGLVANWEWGNDTGSTFSQFVAKA